MNNFRATIAPPHETKHGAGAPRRDRPSGDPVLPVVVLGAGVAGLAAADALARAGHEALVLDAAPRCGGAHRSEQIGPYSFDAGSIFYEVDGRLFDIAPEARALCRPVRRVQRRVSPGGDLKHYPIEPRDVLQWPLGQRLRAGFDLLRRRLVPLRDGTVDGACRSRLGDTIYRDSGLADYIGRFHHLSPRAIHEEFFYRRMALIERATRNRAILRALWLALRRQPVRPGHRVGLLVRPAEGMQPLFATVQRALEARGVAFALDTEATGIARNDDGSFTVRTRSGAIRAAAVVSTLPIDLCHRLVHQRPSGLESLDLLTLFVSVGRLDEAAGNVLFNFDHSGRWKRATIYSRLYPELHRAREFMSVEVTLSAGQAPDPEAAFADFAAHLGGLGHMSDDARLEGHTLIPSAYPLYRLGAAHRSRPILDGLIAFGVIPVGRMGRFEYHPTSTRVIRSVRDELERAGLVGGTVRQAAPEPTGPTASPPP